MKTEILKNESLSIIKIDNIKQLANIGPEVEKVIEQNPFIEPDETTINQAEESRKNLKKGRTTIENLRKDVKGKILAAGKVIDDFSNELKEKIAEAEEKQSNANYKFFDFKAWERAKEANTKEAYISYLENFTFHQVEASGLIHEIEQKEAKEIERFESWATEYFNRILLCQTLDQLDEIESQLDLVDLDSFIDPDKAFKARENMYNSLDQVKNKIEEKERQAAEAEKQRLEIEKQKAEIEKQRKEAEEKARILAEKQAAELAKQKEENQKNNFENAVFVLDSIKTSLKNIPSLDAINPYYTKLESVIEKDYGKHEQELRTIYKEVKSLLDSKHAELLEVEREKQAEAKRIEAEKQAEIEKQKQAEIESQRAEVIQFNKDRELLLTEIENQIETFVKSLSLDLIEKYNLANETAVYFKLLLTKNQKDEM